MDLLQWTQIDMVECSVTAAVNAMIVFSCHWSMPDVVRCKRLTCTTDCSQHQDGVTWLTAAAMPQYELLCMSIICWYKFVPVISSHTITLIGH